MKDFWNGTSEDNEKKDNENIPKGDRISDEELILPLIALLISDEKNRMLAIALLYILS